MSRRPKPTEPPGDDDARLWAEVTRSVKPLKKPAAPPAEQAPKSRGVTAPETATRDDAPKAPLQAPKIGGKAAGERPMAVVGGPEHERRHGEAPGVDKRTAARFKRGLMPIEATLDLHGHTRDSGRQALTTFLQSHQAAGRRCVLVVTGKGLKGDDWSPGVLREAVPGWLNAPPLRDIVLSFAYGQPRHGGSGALYVLLKRSR
jgi:DNA-nicking Smr family endonuclease